MRNFSFSLVLLLSVSISLSACARKEAPKTDDVAVQADVHDEAAKAPENTGVADTASDPKSDDSEVKVAADKPEANAPSEKVDAKPIDPEQAKSMDLAVDSKSCVITHCKSFPGFEENGLDCNTEAILQAGYKLGDKVLHAMLVKRAGAACEVKETVTECFLTAADYLKQSKLRKDNSLVDLLCDPRDCVLTDVTACDESDKDLAIDPKTCQVTHCKSFPGFEDNGLECDTNAIVKAGYALGNPLFRLTYYKFTGDNCNNPDGLPDISVKCFLKAKDFKKACIAKGNDYCDNDTTFIDDSACPKESE